jgi:hypothetical protein
MPRPERQKKYDRKRPVVAVRVDPETLNDLMSASTDAGMTLSQYQRRALEAQLERDRKKQQKKD